MMSFGKRFLGALIFLRAFARTRWGYRFRCRADFDQWQDEQRQRFLHREASAIPLNADLSLAGFYALPVMDKLAFQRKFSQLNHAGVSFEEALELGLRAERERDFKPMLSGGVTVGLSSGTSGNRGVFLVNERERQTWAGVMLARVLSSRALLRMLNPFSRPLRVAFFLRANSNLYTTVHGARLHFYFGDLLQPFHALLASLNPLQPDLLIAPASVLHQLALAQLAGKLSISPMQVISVAEVLEDDDARCVRQAWNVRTGQIYQCTEGFLGYTCAAGRLHLNEEFVHIEPEWLDAGHSRFVPIITDFTRQTQVLVRYRLDDVLRNHPEPCPCGRVTHSVAAIEGRQDDVLWLPAEGGKTGATDAGLVAIFPDLVRRAFLMAQDRFSDYRLEQQGMNWRVRLCLDDAGHGVEEQVRRELLKVCQANGCSVPDIHFQPWQPPQSSQKRRRIRCMAQPGVQTTL